MAYPGSLPSFAGFTSSHTLAVGNHAAQHNLEQSEIVAIATKLGTGASTATSGTVLRGTGVGATAFGQIVLTTDVTSVLPIANGGTGASSGTGSGSPVFATSPTLTTPTLTTPNIADFTSATHTHASNAQGGQLNGSTALQANSVDNTILGTHAITLDYAERTSDFTTATAGSYVDVTSLTVTVTVPSGGRRIKVTGFCRTYKSSQGAGNAAFFSIAEDGTIIAESAHTTPISSYAETGMVIASKIPTPGSHTYKIQGQQAGAGTYTVDAGVTYPAFILVELI